MREYPGNYSAFLEIRGREDAEVAAAASAAQKQQRQQQAAPVAAAPVAQTKSSTGRQLSFKERKELDKLERQIETAESKKAEIEAEMTRLGADYTAVQKLMEDLAKVEAELAASFERWSELAEHA